MPDQTFSAPLTPGQSSRIESLSIFTGTWNINGNTPKERPDLTGQSLAAWIEANTADIYVIGFQVRA